MSSSACNDHSDNMNATQKLKFTTKLAYGAGDLGPAIAGNISIFFTLVFLTNVAGISAGLAGSVLLIGKIWDAVNDPVIGVLTDKTKSRWGRRLPWIFYGAVPFGIFFFLLWIVPPGMNSLGLFWYYVTLGTISQVFYTIVNLPYTAMTPELTQDYDERTQLNSFRFAFSIGGSILSLILAKVIFDSIANRQQQYLVLAAICAVIAVLSLYSCIWGIRDRILAFEAKRSQVEESESIPIPEQLKIAFSNRPFVFVIAIYLFSWLAVQVTASIIPYYVVDCMKLKESDVPTVLICVQGTALLMLFVWSNLSQKVGKKAVYFSGMILWIIAQIGLFFLQPSQLGLMYVMVLMAGCGVSVAYLVPWSMIPDVIELDELETGQRREGLFYGFMVMLQKFGLALGLFLVGIALETSGFQEAVQGQAALPVQPESAIFAIRMAIAPLPTICLILALFLTYFYPITREMHAEILLKLKQRKEEEHG
ncbi:MAG: MFS transporter [Richelia sp.]|nr:MFS transporter [Richelia sp.]